MVSLREKAIKAAKEHEERKEKEKRESAKEFAERAKKAFEETFGEVVEVEPISRASARILADGLSFIARHKSTDFVTYIDFYPQIECSRCGKLFTYQYPCKNLADVGTVLMKEVVCDACLYENVDTPQATKSPAERVLELLSEILEIIEEERGGE